MRRAKPVGFRERAVMTVVVMQAAKHETGLRDGIDELLNVGGAAFFDAGAIHAGVDVDENAEAAALPLTNLVFVFGEHGDFYGGELLGDLANAARVGADGRVGKENVGGAGFAGSQKFERGGALEIFNAPRD
jgi:hypothetical protein